MFKRNRHLVDCSSVCVCYLTKPSGGTAYTVKYAASGGLTIVNIAGHNAYNMQLLTAKEKTQKQVIGFS